MVEDPRPAPQSAPPPALEAQAGGGEFPSSETSPAALPELPGFRFIQELSATPHAVVYKARRLVEQDLVAIKLYRADVAGRREFRERLQRHAENSFLLEHPGLARCLEIREEGGHFALILEYARGEPLARALQRNARFLPPRALALTHRCAEALAYAAAQERFHGRLHPGDVILEEDEVRLLGVGLGEIPAPLPPPGRRALYLFPPLIYVAPEAQPPHPPPQTAEARRAADLYALGAIFFHMLTGNPLYRGADESELALERTVLGGAIRWPRDAAKSLPPAALAVTERLLLADPAARGDYAALLRALEEAYRAATAGPAMLAPRGGAVPAAASLAPLERPSPQPAPSAPALTPRPARFSTAPRAVAAGVVFLLAALILWRIGSFAGRPPEASNGPAGVGPAGAVEEAARTPPPPPAATAEESASKRLEVIRQMLRSGETQPTPALLGLLRELIAEAGPNTPAGIRAGVLKAEVEEALARAAPAGQAAAPGAESGALWREHLRSVRALAAQRRFGAALTALLQPPPGLPQENYAQEAEQERARLGEQAKAAFAEISREAERSLAGGNFSRAREQYAVVRDLFGLPEPVAAAQERLRAVEEAEARQRAEAAKREARERQARQTAAFQGLLRSVCAKAGLFQHAAARKELEEWGRRAEGGAEGGAEQRWAAEYGALLTEEQDFFERCRGRLKERPLEISVGVEREGPFEIEDFGLAGLSYSARRKGALGILSREWTRVSPRQAFILLQLLADAANPRERLTLATTAFHQRWRAEELIRQAEAARGGAQDPRAVELLGRQRAEANELRADCESESGAALESQTEWREKAQAARALLQKMDEILAAPPPPAPPAALPPPASLHLPRPLEGRAG